MDREGMQSLWVIEWGCWASALFCSIVFRNEDPMTILKKAVALVLIWFMVIGITVAFIALARRLGSPRHAVARITLWVLGGGKRKT